MIERTEASAELTAAQLRVDVLGSLLRIDDQCEFISDRTLRILEDVRKDVGEFVVSEKAKRKERIAKPL